MKTTPLKQCSVEWVGDKPAVTPQGRENQICIIILPNICRRAMTFTFAVTLQVLRWIADAGVSAVRGPCGLGVGCAHQRLLPVEQRLLQRSVTSVFRMLQSSPQQPLSPSHVLSLQFYWTSVGSSSGGRARPQKACAKNESWGV